MTISIYKKITFTLLLAIFAFLPAFPVVEAQECPDDQKGYCLLEPIFADQVNKRVDMAGYLYAIYKVFFITAGILATLMLIWGGFQYMTSEIPGMKGKGKDQMTNAIGGLLLAFGSYLILNTINPALTKINFNLRPIPNIQSGTDTTTTPPPSGGCNGCVSVQNLPIKPGIHCTADPNGCQVGGAMYSKLLDLDSRLKALNVGWRITEAYPPDPIHKATCHYNGSCIDANFSTGIPPTGHIIKFQSAASASGLRAVYEVKTQAQADALKQAGVTGEIGVFDWITAPHFSVY